MLSNKLLIFKVVGKSREGNVADFRILRFFVSEIRQLQSDLTTMSFTSPLFIIGGCRDKNKCSSDVCGSLLHHIAIASMSDEERFATLKWLLEESSLEFSTPLEDLARRMHGFRLGDLNAVISIATRYLNLRTNQFAYLY